MTPDLLQFQADSEDSPATLARRFEHEHALIACCLEDACIVDQLTEDLFGDEQARSTYRWLARRRQERKADPGLAETLHSLSKDHFGLYLAALQWLPLCHSPANWPYWEEQAREAAVLRESASLGRQLSEESKSGHVDLSAASESLRRIDASRRLRSTSSIAAVADEALADMEARYGREQPYAGVSTGFPQLDGQTDALTKKGLWVIAARPSVGKTTFGCNLAIATAVHAREATAFFSLEMPAHVIAQKLFHCLGAVSQEQRKRHTLPEAGFVKLGAAKDRIVASPLAIVDSCRSIQAIGAEIRRLKAECGLRVVIIDYLQRVTVEGSKEDRWHDIGRVSNALKDLAMDNDVTVVALAQLNRDVEKAGREPGLADLRGSAEIEADADVVAFLWRDEAELKLSVGKSRMGQTGKIQFHANLDTCEMREEHEKP